jgi:very-short-patch-repair endonuclease
MAPDRRAIAAKVAAAGAQWDRVHDLRARGPKVPIASPVWEPVHVAGEGEREILRVAGAQKAFVVREQLLAAGFGRGAISHRMQTGWLYRYYPGVFLVGRPSLEPLGAEMAAVLLHRGHAILSHRSAAWVWGLLDTQPTEVTLTAVGVDRRSRPGLRLHRVSELARRDLRACQGLPLTGPARTVLDLAGDSTDHEFEQAMALARDRGLASDDELAAAIERAPRRKGATRLVRLMQGGVTSGLTRSHGERRLRALLRAADLPQPAANAPLLGYIVDFLWPEVRLIVEVDGFQFHSSRKAFEHDRKRDQRFAAAGYLVIRVTMRQLENEPFAVIARIAQAMAARAA